MTQGAAKVENLRRGEYGVVEEKNGYLLDKRRDPANGLTYYVVYDEQKLKMWTVEEAPWDFRRAVKLLRDLGTGVKPADAKEEKFNWM